MEGPGGAEAIGSTTAAVNSLLQRARAQLHEVSPREETLLEPEDPMLREQLRQYINAFERYDVEAIAKMFTTEAIWEMPPFTGWYQGGPSIAALIKAQCPAEHAGDMRLVETSANGQPAIGLYMREGDGVHRPFQMHVLDVTQDGVAHVVCFFDISLFEKFGLPAELTD
ncbi:Probable alternative RNA polymerase sigma factor SigG [Mycobacteroides abscessus]|nr:Probable alternative RNA polymerase sigma factor SigG [Mycobacteroides abscessus]